MIRRRRRAREIAFSFDSFLDVVANVVGIIIRLILVVWVSARSYSSLNTVPKLNASNGEAQANLSEPEDPLQQELARSRRELADAQARLLEHLRQLREAQEVQAHASTELAALSARRQGMNLEQAVLRQTADERQQIAQTGSLSLADLRTRCSRVNEEIRAVAKLPPLKQTLRYRTPVSRPVQADELLFECRQGRITFINIAPLIAEVRQGIEDKRQLMRTQWQVTDLTGPVGAFQLRYTLERERDLLDGAVAGATPDPNSSFSFGLNRWEVVPIAPIRGETLQAALAPGSEFRQVVDGLDPRQSVVTLWVYPDSFELFRKLRDYLYDRDLVVAGRPLPEDIPITSSRRGSVSRGQ